ERREVRVGAAIGSRCDHRIPFADLRLATEGVSKRSERRLAIRPAGAGTAPALPPSQPELQFGTRRASMARGNTKGSLAEVRDSVKRIRGEGERFLGRARRETQDFARKARSEVASDVRKIRDELNARGERTVHELEIRGRRMVETFEKQVGRVAAAAGKQLGLARLEDMPRLTKRIYELERRVEQLEQELRAAREQPAP